MKSILKLFMLVVLTFSISTAITSCGDDEPDYPNEPNTPVVNPPADDNDPDIPSDDDDPAKYDIVGKWKMESEANYLGTDVIFEIDRSGYLLCTVTYSNGNTFIDNGEWTYDAKIKKWKISFSIYSVGHNYSGTYHKVGDKLIYNNFIFHKYTDGNDGDDTSTPDNIDDSDENQDSRIFGEWYANKTNSLSHKYLLFEDGTGYIDYIQTKGDMGINRSWFHWTTKNGKISLNYEEGRTFEYSYSVEEDVMKITYKNGDSLSFRHYKVSFKTPYGEKPYSNGYILDKSTGYYYEIGMFKEFCNHAKSGEKTNWKSVQFFGSNESLTPTGLYCYYVTPDYDGIDGTWNNGTYYMLGNGGSGYYKYGSVCQINNLKPTLSTSDKLIVEKDGYRYVYDYIGEEVELHFEVTKQ